MSSRACALALLAAARLAAGEAGLIDGFETAPAVERITAVPGRTGQAIQITCEEGWQKMTQVSQAKGSADWDRAAGISFWVKGDGSPNWGAISLAHAGDEPPMAYFATFPLDSREWRKITLAWSDLTPFIPRPDMRPLGPAGKSPAGLGRISFGKLWFFRQFPAHSYAIDDLALEPAIIQDRTDHTPGGDPLARVKALIAAKKPLTWVAMGDSLTDFRHRANRPPVNWPTFTVDGLQAAGCAATLVNAGVGGNQLTHGLIGMPAWLRGTPRPDLVTILFGFNDLDDGITPAQFELWLGLAVDRVRRATGGSADVLIMTTCPAATLWDKPGLGELAEACRRVAKTKNAGLADVATALRSAGGQQPDALFFEDRVHLGAPAHRLIADTLLKTLTGR